MYYKHDSAINLIVIYDKRWIYGKTIKLFSGK